MIDMIVSVYALSPASRGAAVVQLGGKYKNCFTNRRCKILIFSLFGLKKVPNP